EVQVREIGDSELSSPSVRTTLQPDQPSAKRATVEVSVEVHNGAAPRTIVPEGVLARGAQQIPLRFPPRALAHGQTAPASRGVSVQDRALWSPASPSLYQLTLAVGHESSFSARVGLRELSWHSGHVYLNGGRLQLHGATIQTDAIGHGDALTGADE